MVTKAPNELIDRPLFYIKDEKPSGTHGGDFPANIWITRDLNSIIINTIPGASLSANQITLPIGLYVFEWIAPAHAANTEVGNVQSGLYNVTDGIFEKMGSSGSVSQGGSNTTADNPSFGYHILSVISTPKTFEIQHKCSSSAPTWGLGRAGFTGEPEIYTQVEIEKIG
jgi:hypothetical protein